jgi:hypothetical protein
MKKLILTTILLTGCVADTIDKAVNNIPQHEFSEFSCNRAGNASSGSISASGARFENGQHVIDDLNGVNRLFKARDPKKDEKADSGKPVS